MLLAYFSKWTKDDLCIWPLSFLLFLTAVWVQPIISKAHQHWTQIFAHSVDLTITQISRFVANYSLPALHPLCNCDQHLLAIDKINPVLIRLWWKCFEDLWPRDTLPGDWLIHKAPLWPSFLPKSFLVQFSGACPLCGSSWTVSYWWMGYFSHIQPCQNIVQIKHVCATLLWSYFFPSSDLNP